MKLRNCDRPRHKQFPEIRMLENPEEEFDIEANCPDVCEADYLINPSAYREVVWDIKVSLQITVLLSLLYKYLLLKSISIISVSLLVLY